MPVTSLSELSRRPAVDASTGRLDGTTPRVRLDEGTLYVTSHRLFFDGQCKGVTIPLGKIVNFTVNTDGVGIERDPGRDQFFKGAVDG